MPVDESTQNHDDFLWSERWKLVCRTQLSSLYHAKRERFFDGADKFAKAFAAIGGAAAVSQLVADPTAKIWIAALVSILSIISLVFGPAQKARRHGELARDFKRFGAKIEEAGAFIDEARLNKLRAEFLLLESSEPASMSALVRHCENQISVAAGHQSEVIRLTIPQLLFMHFFDFPLQAKPS